MSGIEKKRGQRSGKQGGVSAEKRHPGKKAGMSSQGLEKKAGGPKKVKPGRQMHSGQKERKKQEWKPGNMLYPVPAVMATVSDRAGHDNIITVAWTGTICTNPPMVYISVRPERYSYAMLKETGEFVLNLTTRELAAAADYCGVKSGREVDKFRERKLTRQKASKVAPPLIGESPVNIECRVTQCLELGSHHMFLAEVLAVHVDEAYLDATGRFCLEQADPIVYSHGTYFTLQDALGRFGYSIKKK